ncbi:copia protein [Tanacetum coccineum]
MGFQNLSITKITYVQGKSKKASLLPKLVSSTESKLELLYMDLCGPMRVTSINGKKYILVIIDNGTEFKNEKLQAFYAKLEDEASQIVSSSVEQVATEPNSPVLNENADELVQEDVADFKMEMCSTIHLKLLDKWTKNHPIEQVIGDPSKPVMTRNQIQTDVEVCMYALTSNWIWKNKTDVENTVIRNNSRLVAKGYGQEEGINSEESFAPVIRLKVVRIFVAYAAHNNFPIYAHGRQNGILNGPMKEKVFVHQSDGFIDPDFPNYVYRLKKAQCGPKQAPRAWFINHPEESLYVNHNILWIFLRNMGWKNVIPLAHQWLTKLDAYLQGTQVDQTKYHSMIGGLMHLTASRSDIAFTTFVCARYQAHPTEKRLKEVKRIFRYLRQTINMGIWYSKDSGFDLTAYSDANLSGCNDDCKSTSGGI